LAHEADQPLAPTLGVLESARVVAVKFQRVPSVLLALGEQGKAQSTAAEVNAEGADGGFRRVCRWPRGGRLPASGWQKSHSPPPKGG
jgi:hypothetical protein